MMRALMPLVSASMKANKPTWSLEEYAPGRFIVHDVRVRPFVHGEGELVGNRFVLHSHRGAGLLARIRQRGLVVWALSDQIAALPPLPRLAPLGDTVAHPTRARDRWSFYLPAQRCFQPCEPTQRAGQLQVALQLGTLAWQRHGRSGGEYWYVAPRPQERYELQALTPDRMRLYALALACEVAPPVVVTAQAADMFACQLPELPQAFQQVWERIARYDTASAHWHFAGAQSALVDAFAQQAGLSLVLAPT
jgi:hypothetical protein